MLSKTRFRETKRTWSHLIWTATLPDGSFKTILQPIAVSEAMESSLLVEQRDATNWSIAFWYSHPPSKGYRPVQFSKMKVKDTDTKEVSELTPTVDFDVIGLFDPKKITVSKDPLNEYR